MRKTLITFLPILAVALAPISGHAQSISTVGLVDHFDPAAGLTTNEEGQVTAWVNQADNSRSIGTPSELRTKLILSEDSPPMIQFNSEWQTGYIYDGGLSYASPGSAALESGYTVFVTLSLTDVLADEPTQNRFKRLWRGTDDSHGLYLDKTDQSAWFKANPVAAGSRPRSNYLAEFGVDDIAILTARMTPDSQEFYFNGKLVDSRSSTVASYAIDNATFEIGNGLDIGKIGQVLVYDNSASLTDLDLTGASLGNLYGVAWTPIPEPSTTALFLGLAAIGGLIVRRVRRRT